jgi:hypothetical protein
MTSAMGFDKSMVDSMSEFQLASLPEGTIVTIVETWAKLRKFGAEDVEIFRRIEDHRSTAFPRGQLPSPLSLKTYIRYRLEIEHSHGAPLDDSFVEAAIEAARKAYGNLTTPSASEDTSNRVREGTERAGSSNLRPRPDGLTPCLTPGCTNAPLQVPVTSLFAQVEYRLRRDPRAVLKLSCTQCRRESTYDYGTLFELLPEKLRPTPLPEGVILALLLSKVNTSESMPSGFFGERILTRVTLLSDGWRGRTLGKSQFCGRTLPPGTEVAGPVVNEHFVITLRRSGPTDVPIHVEEVPKNSCFAIMVAPRNEPNLLLSANPFCPNPSCMNVCSLTFTQFENAVAQTAAQAADSSAEPHIVWECTLCHATMMVGTDTFNNLYKM